MIKGFVLGVIVAIILGAAQGATVVTNTVSLVAQVAPYVRDASGAVADAVEWLRQNAATAEDEPAAARALNGPVQVVSTGRLADGVLAVAVPTERTLGLTTGGSTGTAFYVSPGIVLTAQHVTDRFAVHEIAAASRLWWRVWSENPGLDVTVLVPVPHRGTPAIALPQPAVMHPLADAVPVAGSIVDVLCRYSAHRPAERVALVVMSGVEDRRQRVQTGETRTIRAFDARALSGTVRPGCSGAPVVDMFGRAVGVLVAGSDNGVNHVVPATLITEWLRTLRLVP